MLFILHSGFQPTCVTPCVKRSVGGRQVCTLPSLALDEKNSLPSLLSRQGVHKKGITEVSAVSIFAFKWCARGVLLLNVVHHLLSFCRGNDVGISGWSRKGKARRREPVFNDLRQRKESSSVHDCRLENFILKEPDTCQLWLTRAAPFYQRSVPEAFVAQIGNPRFQQKIKQCVRACQGHY